MRHFHQISYCRRYRSCEEWAAYKPVFFSILNPKSGVVEGSCVLGYDAVSLG